MRSARGKVQRQQRRPGRVLRRVRGDLACGAQRQAIHDRCSQGICYVPMGRSWGTGFNFCICWRGVHLQGVGTVAVISAWMREKGVAACEANLDDGNRASAAASPRQRTTKPRMQPLIVQDPRNEVLCQEPKWWPMMRANIRRGKHQQLPGGFFIDLRESQSMNSEN